MEATLSLQANLYPKITPAGAYYAVSSDTPSASRTLLYGLLRAEPSETISSEKNLGVGGYQRHQYRFEPAIPPPTLRIFVW